MNKRDPYDPKLLIAIFVVLVSIWVWRAISSIHPAQLLASVALWLVPSVLGTIAIASALAAQRIRATRRALGKRVVTAVVPADEFEATPEAVLRFAAGLVRSQRGLRGWFERRAGTLRVRLANDRRGNLVYMLEVPRRSRELASAALRGYEGVEVRAADEVLPEHSAGQPVRLRTELRLSRASVEPLAHLELDPDPLQPFAAAMASLDAERGERLDVCIDLLPLTGRREGRLQRKLKRQAKRLHGERRSLTEILNNERPRRSDPALQFERRRVGEALRAKLRDADPLFEAQILLSSEAADKPRAKRGMQLLLAAFEPLAAHNRLRPSGLGIGDSVLFGADFPTRRRSFLHDPGQGWQVRVAVLAVG